jgi:hypothetical protein
MGWEKIPEDLTKIFKYLLDEMALRFIEYANERYRGMHVLIVSAALHEASMKLYLKFMEEELKKGKSEVFETVLNLHRTLNEDFMERAEETYEKIKKGMEDNGGSQR